MLFLLLSGSVGTHESHGKLERFDHFASDWLLSDDMKIIVSGVNLNQDAAELRGFNADASK